MKDPKLCSEPYCMNRHRKGRKICATCDKAKWRAKYPMKAAFQTLRHNATRRNKFFDLTFEQFKKFCRKYKYMAGKGRSKDSYTIDCIDPAMGYTESNIQVLSMTKNASKGNKILHYDWQTKTAKVI